MVLPLYGHANRFGRPESKRVLNVVQFDCNSIRLPGPDDVTWRVTCAIVYIAADSTSTDAGHYVAFRRVGDVRDKTFVKLDDDRVCDVRKYANFQDIKDVYVIILERNIV